MEAHRVLLNCVGGKMLWMLLQNGGTEFMFCLCVVGTHSWKCNRKCCFWQTIVKCEPVLKRAHLSVWVFPCISELLCWRRRLLWGSALSTFPVSHTLSPAPFGISCVSVCSLPCSVPLALSNCISGKCLEPWLFCSSAALAKCYYGLSE